MSGIERNQFGMLVFSSKNCSDIILWTVVNPATPTLRPSSIKTVGMCMGPWFLLILLVFNLPFLLLTILGFLGNFASPFALRACISMFEVSPFGTTAVIGYFLLHYYIYRITVYTPVYTVFYTVPYRWSFVETLIRYGWPENRPLYGRNRNTVRCAVLLTP